MANDPAGAEEKMDSGRGRIQNHFIVQVQNVKICDQTSCTVI